jgi:hypothetical protein
VRRDRLGNLDRAGQKAVRWHDLVGDAYAKRGCRIDGLAAQRHLPGETYADRVGEARAHAAARKRTDPGVSIGKAGLIGGKDEIAGKREFQPARIGRSVDRGDHRLAEVRDRPNEFAHQVARRIRGGERLEIESGAEGRGAAGYDRGTPAVLGLEPAEGAVERLDERQVYRIALIRPIKRQDHDPWRGLRDFQDRAHFRSPKKAIRSPAKASGSSIAAKCPPEGMTV